MTTTEEILDGHFVFGNPITGNRDSVVTWNPDAEGCINPHLVISGETGSGKSSVLKKVVGYLAHQNKHIYILDIHGDLAIRGVEENYIEFKARNSDHGINPFVFDIENKETDGVQINIASMVMMIKKAFLPNLGGKQEAVLRRLIEDCYRIHGIFDDDESTWSNPFPSMETLLDLIETLIVHGKKGGNGIADQLKKMESQRRKLKELDYSGVFKRVIEASGLNEDAIAAAIEERFGNKEDENSHIRVEAMQNNPAARSDIIAGQIEWVLEEMTAVYGATHAGKIISALKSIDKTSGELEFLLLRYKEFCQYGMHEQMFGSELPEQIDPADYQTAAVLKTLESLQIYISSITTSGIFKDKQPPVRPGLNRLDISTLSNDLQSFFVDAFVHKIFRAVRGRGEYQKTARKRGEKVDTYIVIDEGLSIMPSAREKDNHKQILNRVMYEARKFGLGLIFVSQAPSHYSKAILSAYTKVVLKTPENEVKNSMSLLGVTDKGLFRLIERPYTALVGTGSNFIPLTLAGGKSAPTGHNLGQTKMIPAANTQRRSFALKGGRTAASV